MTTNAHRRRLLPALIALLVLAPLGALPARAEDRPAWATDECLVALDAVYRDLKPLEATLTAAEAFAVLEAKAGVACSLDTVFATSATGANVYVEVPSAQGAIGGCGSEGVIGSSSLTLQFPLGPVTLAPQLAAFTLERAVYNYVYADGVYTLHSSSGPDPAWGGILGGEIPLLYHDATVTCGKWSHLVCNAAGVCVIKRDYSACSGTATGRATNLDLFDVIFRATASVPNCRSTVSMTTDTLLDVTAIGS